MIARRDMLIGGACALASAGAWALTPRNHLTLLGNQKLDDLIPHVLPGWRELSPEGLIVPVADDSLTAKLYNQVVGRIYADADDRSVMVLIAYGRTQNDALQLHRPEICYPAVGYAITASAPVRLPVGKTRTPIPARALTADNLQQVEQILYWTRIGESFPESGSEQRLVKFRLQLRGIVPDGVLVRFSNVLHDPVAGLALNERFARAFLAACPPVARLALAGSAVSRALEETA